MRACAAAVSPAALHANTWAHAGVWNDNSASLTRDAQNLNMVFWHFSIHLEGSGGAGRGWSSAEGAWCCLPPPPVLSDTVCCYIYGTRTVSPCWEQPQQRVWQGNPIAMSLSLLLFTASSRDFFTSRSDLGQSQRCKAKGFPTLSAKPQH